MTTISQKHQYSEFQITNHPKVWVSTFPSANRNGKLALAIIKKWKNGGHFMKNHHTAKFQITDAPKFGSPLFLVSMGFMENWLQPL